MKVTCEKCSKEFETTQKILIETRLAPDLLEVYFLCPSCKAKYHVCWHNAETKNLQKLVRKAVNSGKHDQAEEYKAKLKKCMDELNNRL